jgi:hypothetical protein
LVVGLNAPSAPVDGKRVHPPVTQGDPFGQVTPQPPQWLASLCVSTQLPLQSVRPGLQVAEQVDPRQAGVPLATAGQTLPQPPQLFASVRVSAQALAQTVSPTAQTRRQVPATQACPPEHAPPQRPQCAGSVSSETQLPLQSVRPVPHDAVQLPEEHT